MGNRAVITFRQTASSPSVYLHWNGGRASVEAFLAAARDLGLRNAGADYQGAVDFIASVARTFIGGSVYVGPFGRQDSENGDNGTYVLDHRLDIVQRTGLRDSCVSRHGEEVDPEKTAGIYAECVARHAHFNA